jgi:hypothetical protein
MNFIKKNKYFFLYDTKAFSLLQGKLLTRFGELPEPFEPH